VDTNYFHSLRKIVTPQVLGFGLVIVALPLTLILASTTQNLREYANTYNSPRLNEAVQKQQAMITDQTQFLAELDQTIDQTDANNSITNFSCGDTITGTAIAPQMQMEDSTPTPVMSADWTAADDAAESADIQTEQDNIAQANAIQTELSDIPAVQLQKGAQKLSLILNAVKTKVRRHKRHCRHHHKKTRGNTGNTRPPITSIPSQMPKQPKAPKQTKTPKNTTTISPSDTPSPTPGI